MGYPEVSTFLNPEWLKLFKFAALEAKRFGLELGFNNSAGYDKHQTRSFYVRLCG
jgi:hypothetical protein